MTNGSKFLRTASLFALALGLSAGVTGAAKADGAAVEALAAARAEAAALDARLQRLEDVEAIEILQRTYGFLVDKALWHEAADLFAEDGTLEIGGRGVFVGKARILEYFQFLGPEGPMRGRLIDHMQLQPIVHVSEDGLSAKARVRFVAMGGTIRPEGEGVPESEIYSTPSEGYLGMGNYENAYVKEGGVWKIKTLHAYFRMYTRDTEWWVKRAFPMTRPEKDLPPDRPPTVVYDMYPDTFHPPFHYKHPVTGE